MWFDAQAALPKWPLGMGRGGGWIETGKGAACRRTKQRGERCCGLCAGLCRARGGAVDPPHAEMSVSCGTRVQYIWRRGAIQSRTIQSRMLRTLAVAVAMVPRAGCLPHALTEDMQGPISVVEASHIVGDEIWQPEERVLLGPVLTPTAGVRVCNVSRG